MSRESKVALAERALATTAWSSLAGTVFFFPADTRAVVVKGDDDVSPGDAMLCVQSGVSCFRWEKGRDGWLPDMDHPATQGVVLTLIARHNRRRSIYDALGDAHHKMGQGRTFPEALVELLEESNGHD